MMTGRDKLFLTSPELAALVRINDEEGLSSRQVGRRMGDIINPGVVRNAITRLKRRGLVREGEPYWPRENEGNAGNPTFMRVPLFMTEAGRKQLGDHLYDIAGIEST